MKRKFFAVASSVGVVFLALGACGCASLCQTGNDLSQPVNMAFYLAIDGVIALAAFFALRSIWRNDSDENS